MLFNNKASRLINLKCPNSTGIRVINFTESIKVKHFTQLFKNLLLVMSVLEWSWIIMVLLKDGGISLDQLIQLLLRLRLQGHWELCLELMALRMPFTVVTHKNQLEENVNSFSEETIIPDLWRQLPKLIIAHFVWSSLTYSRVD